MNAIIRTLLSATYLFALCLPTASGANLVEGRESLTLLNSEAKLVIDLAGGSFREFRFTADSTNPLNWGQPRSGATAPKVMGHFLCLDRWGPPSEAEGANGMPYHGEAGRQVWLVNEDVHEHDGILHTTMSASLPLAGLGISRSVQMSPDQAVVLVQETVTNMNKLGRPYNMVQPPSIGPPFLTEETIVDANGRKGFAQGGTLPSPEEPSFYWPQALNQDGQIVNLRHLHADHHPNVTSFTIDESIGWVTAATPKQGLLIGYIWPTTDYPWLDIWRNSRDGKPNARGLEFGTTGLHQPFPVLMEKGRIFGRRLFEYLDAGESTDKRFAMFLLRVPEDFQGVRQLQLRGNAIHITERAEKPREFEVSLGGLTLDFNPLD